MEWSEICVDGQHTVKFTDLPYVPLASPHQPLDCDALLVGRKQGGIFRHGEWAWLARNSVLQIVSLRNGQTISSYEFCESRGYERCCIKWVEELFPNNSDLMLLAVILESYSGSGGGCSYVSIYSIELSSVLSSIELSLHLTCGKFMDTSVCRRSLLQNFDGCLAVGSEEGVIVLLDLNIRKVMSICNELHDDLFLPCHIVDYSLPLTEIHRNYKRCQRDGINFGLQMEVIESPCAIKSILPIDLILGLAIGLADGRLALYDVAELQIFYVALPNPEVAMSAVVKMDFLEPPDDPRPSVFIWSVHENGENLHAVLHNLMYEKCLVGEDESSRYFETFQTCSVRLQLPLEATKSVGLACQAVTNLPNHGEDDSNCLCAISWLSVLERKNKLLIFDLNQWYKEEMPCMLEYGKQPNYLAGYILNGECTGLNTLLKANSIAHFNSMQRFEEHFYPNSLSFESLLLHAEGCRNYNWEGAQNRVINFLRSSNAAIFLEPNLYFNEIIRARLMPQFIDLNINSTFSREAKYEVLLSCALEHNCVNLLRDCAKSWLDGSFMGNFSASTGLCLSTLTDWIWKRATCIKSRCNDLCKSLFDYDGYPLDNREQKELGFITRQLKLLSDLLGEILLYAKKQISEKVFGNLENKYNSLSMASSYQEILLWLLNIGLLPTGTPNVNNKIVGNNAMIPYPYQDLKVFYENKRTVFSKINETFISKKSGSCKLLFIDAFIEHLCKGNILHEYWLENEGNGLYPPNSLEAMMRVMLVPNLSYENKCAILLYFFLDLNMAIDEEVYKDVVVNFIKFPSVFKLSAPLIKTVQAFWNLDHDLYLPAVDEFISPFNKNQCYPQWQVELFIEVLLNQNVNNLALRILESQPSLISPLLKLNTLLANDLISEAFHFVRSKNDDSLLETYFICCLRNGHFGVIRDLALSDREGLILQNILKRSKAPGAESLHFVYLLQKSKYLEAVSYMEELTNKGKGIKGSLHQTSEIDTPNLVLSAFNSTLTPVTQGLTDVYFRIKNKIKKKEVDNKSPVPLSCQLIKQNANSLLGGIYHSSALSAHFATYYWGEMEEQTKETKHLLNASNAPFLRKPQIDTNGVGHLLKNVISYPQAYKFTEKRTLVECGRLDNDQDNIERLKMEHKLNPKKKRRLIGQEIYDDLSHYMKRNNNLNVPEFTFDKEPTAESQVRKNSLDLLTRPLAKAVKEFDEKAVPSPQIHSILKTHITTPGQLQCEVPVDEEKNLRFQLPSADVSAADISQHEVTSADVTITPKEYKSEKEVTKTDSPKIKKVMRAESLESIKSSISSDNKSEESFYSPLSSQHISKLDCSDLNTSHSFLSGPQPRKALHRYSAESSKKSVTPELLTKTLALKSKISPRSSIEKYSSDCLKTAVAPDHLDEGRVSSSRSNITKDLTAKETTNEACVTACKTFTKTLTYSYPDLKQEFTQTTSGFSGMAGSKFEEFSPPVSSSTIGVEKQPAIKLSECSTVLGTLSTLDSTNTTSNAGNKSKSDPAKTCDVQARQMLETTLGMTNYDISTMDFTPLQETKSSLMMTSKEITLIQDLPKTSEEKEIGLGAAEVQEMECDKVFDEREKSNSDCIVLSSPSTSRSLQSSQSGDDIVCENSYIDLEVDMDLDGSIHDDNFDFRDNEESDKELPMQENDSYDEENEDDIQLIEDSSSDEQLQQMSFCNASDSEDVELIDVENPLRTDFHIKESAALKEGELVKEGNIEVLTASISTASPSRNIENISTLTKEVTRESQPEELEEKEKQKQNVMDKKKVHSASHSKPVTAEKNESKMSENEHKESSNFEKNREMGEVIENSVESSKVLKIKDPIFSEENIKNKLELEITKDLITEAGLKRESDGETMNTAAINKTFEEDGTCSVGISEQSADTDNKESEVDIGIKEKHAKNIKDSPTEFITENRCADFVGIRGQHREKPQSLVEKEQTDRESTSKYVTLEKTEVKMYENESKGPSNSKKDIELMEVLETVEEKQVILTRADTIDEEADIEMVNNSPVAQTSMVKRDHTNLDKQSDVMPTLNIRNDENLTPSSNEVKAENNLETLKENNALVITFDSYQEKKELPVEKALISTDIHSKVDATEKHDKKLEGNEIVESEIIDEEVKTNQQLGLKNKMGEKDSTIIESTTNPELKAVEISTITGAAKKTEGENNEGIKIELQVKAISSDSIPITKQSKQDPPVGFIASASTPRRNTCGISVPPQTNIESEDFSNPTIRTRRNIRASSLQPKYKAEDVETETPRQIGKSHNCESTPKRSKRGSSAPPDAVEDKTSTRRRSILLESINEDPITIDSPSTRTRLKSRLNSMDSEIDSPLVCVTEQPLSQKRTRRTSMSHNSNELILTPKRSRARSISSEKQTPGAVNSTRTLRARSVVSVQEEDSETTLASPKPTSGKKIVMKRKTSTNMESPIESKEESDQISPKSDQLSPYEASYSASRRLTRTQLAVMERSLALSQSLTKDYVNKELASPTSNKRSTKARATRSSNANADSDDAESLSSKFSSTSSATGTKRRVTRSSIKEKDDADVDDDAASIASSIGSEKRQRTRRPKEKSSPNAVLTTIPEDGPIETKQRRRTSKH